jgi:outer membrane lipopolysaccharide assembly protein LptE/RlpB
VKIIDFHINNEKNKNYKIKQIDLIFTYPYNACTNNFRQTLNDSGGAVFLWEKESKFILIT